MTHLCILTWAHPVPTFPEEARLSFGNQFKKFFHFLENRKRDVAALCGEACRLCVPPGHEVFDAGFGVSVEDGAEGVGEIVDGVHAGHFAGGDERGEHGPVLGADLVAGEEGVLAGQRDRTDLVFDRVGVELEGAVVEEADQAGPMREGIADILGQKGFRKRPV